MSTRLPALIKVGRHSELRLALAPLEKLFASYARADSDELPLRLPPWHTPCAHNHAAPETFCEASRMPPGPLNLGHLCSARPSASTFITAEVSAKAQDAPHIKPNCVLHGAQADAHAPTSSLVLRRRETGAPNLIESCMVSTAAADHDVQKQESGEEGENNRAAPKRHPQRVRQYQWKRL